MTLNGEINKLINLEKKLLDIITANDKYLKEHSQSRNDLATINKFTEIYIVNAFSYMLLNRFYRSRIKFNATKYLDLTIKNISFFFLAWDNVLDKNDYFELKRKSPDFYRLVPNQRSIKNFSKIGLAIDQTIKLYANAKNLQQLVNFKKKNLLLVLALLDIKKAYIEIDPVYPNSVLYQQFIHLIKREVLEYIDLELSQQSIIPASKRQTRPIKDLIVFGEHLSHFLRNFGEDDSTASLEKKINICKKNVLNIEKKK